MRRSLALASLILALLAAPAAARADGVVPVEGRWSGRTTDGLVITFLVENGTVGFLDVGIRQTVCGVEVLHLVDPVPIEPDGHWLLELYPGLDVQGTFDAAGHVSGKITVPGRSTPSCGKDLATFTARPGSEPPPPPPLRINDGTGKVTRRPPARISASRDGSFYFYGLHWSVKAHGTHVRATGRAYIHRKGVEIRPQVEIHFTFMEDFPRFRAYRDLTYELRGPLPPGIERVHTLVLPEPKQ
jgi:hypothetical protein